MRDIGALGESTIGEFIERFVTDEPFDIADEREQCAKNFQSMLTPVISQQEILRQQSDRLREIERVIQIRKEVLGSGGPNDAASPGGGR